MNSSDKSVSLLTENEIDTALFSIFEIFSKQLTQPWHVCLCNPPGGDWSRISIVSSDDKSILIWNTLPRVREDSKLPDFVVQTIIEPTNESYIINIESKDRPKSLESNIGNRMNDFMQWLIGDVGASMVRKGTTKCNESTSPGKHKLISAVATTFDPKSYSNILEDIWNRCHCDMCFNIIRQEDKVRVILYISKEGIEDELHQRLIQTLREVADYADFSFSVNES